MHVCKSHVLIKGDMMVEPSLENVRKSQTGSVRLKRTAIADRRRIWDFGVVPFEIDTTARFNDNEISIVKAAMRHWEKFSCIKFVERNAVEHKDFIRFTKDDSKCDCCSHLGKMGGGQNVWIGNCDNNGSIAHELGHVIGFHHEQKRPDRDEYIEIKKDNYPSYRRLVFQLFWYRWKGLNEQLQKKYDSISIDLVFSG